MKQRVARPSIGPQIEKAIRPFVGRPPEWRVSRPRRPEDDEEEPVLEWSASTRTQVLTLMPLGFRTVDGEDEREEEVEREVSVRRVENPDDPDQFVDVEVIDEIVFRDPLTGRLRRYVLDN